MLQAARRGTLARRQLTVSLCLLVHVCVVSRSVTVVCVAEYQVCCQAGKGSTCHSGKSIQQQGGSIVKRVYFLVFLNPDLLS